ncbi:MAG: orotidine-5'-phosphate decarboxylase [Sphingobacteriia bacterium]|nr:MAG: orotidine-5'-phosphate decarboxylase [Sphingobacteriia bacterium]
MKRAALVQQIKEKQSFLCVGLDTDPQKLPPHLQGQKNGVVTFNKAIIEATLPYCVSYKINTAFYESQGLAGWEAMAETLAAIPSTHLTIADAKRGDIGNTSAQYAKTFFEVLPFDAITVAPYMGEDSVRPFLEYTNKWTIVLALTSNAGSFDFQQLSVNPTHEDLNLVPQLTLGHGPKRLFEKVLEKTAAWGSPDQLMFVVGATQANALENIRSIVPDHFLLVPGVGFQGGSLAEVAEHGLNKEAGLLVNASRAIIFAGGGEDFAEAAQQAAATYQAEMASLLQTFG